MQTALLYCRYDRNAEYIECETAFPYHGDRIRDAIDVLYDGKTLPFADCSFDAVVSFEVFEHIRDVEAVVFEISRVTKPSGELLVSIPLTWGRDSL